MVELLAVLSSERDHGLPWLHICALPGCLHWPYTTPSEASLENDQDRPQARHRGLHVSAAGPPAEVPWGSGERVGLRDRWNGIQSYSIFRWKAGWGARVQRGGAEGTRRREGKEEGN